MPDILLHVNGQQAGPYSVAQVRQLLAEGKITAEIPAWYAGLTQWSTVAQVLAAFPVEAGAAPPPPAPSQPPPAAKKGMSGCLIAALVVGGLCFFGFSVMAILAGIALGPITKGIEKAKESAAIQQSRAIELAMVAYADHNGAYPGGSTSTQVFQKLLDGNYIADPGLFYILGMPGKVRATSNQLTADNVCFDVTSGITASSPDQLPVVFVTGYTIHYSGGVPPDSLPGFVHPFPGMAVAYKNSSAHFWQALPDGRVPGVVPVAFDPGGATYQQLTP